VRLSITLANDQLDVKIITVLKICASIWSLAEVKENSNKSTNQMQQFGHWLRLKKIPMNQPTGCNNLVIG